MPWTDSQTMTRHALTENFDNRDVALAKGELVIILENERSGERGFGAGDRYPGGLERVGGYHHVMVKTRHGRKVRVPRHILSKEIVVFKCQLCYHQALSTYREYVDHMIDKHLRVQLLKGLDMTKKQPTCPFPSCHGMTWPIVDNLLFHYASHHNVLEKVVMYESEVSAEELRQAISGKESTIEELVKEIGDLKNCEAESDASEIPKEGVVHEGNIQGAKEMRVIMGEMKEEVALLKQKLGSKNSIIKSLKDELNEAKRSFKSCEKRYEDVVKYNLTIQNDLKNAKTEVDELKAKMEVDIATVTAAHNDEDKDSVENSRSSSADEEVSELRAKVAKLQAELEGQIPEENGVSSSGETSSKINNAAGNVSNQEEMLADLRGKVVRMSDQNEAWQKQNDSLQLEIENMHMQNENLKNIIEIGKSTVETAKKISQELAEENKLVKQNEVKCLEDQKKVENELKRCKSENQNLHVKYKELQSTLKSQTMNFAKLQDEIESKTAEIHQLQGMHASNAAVVKEDAKVVDKNIKLMVSVKEDLKSKLIKCRENCRSIEDSKRSLDRDYKALIVENRNAANEIKTLKNHLNSNRAIVVERAVAKDEAVNLKTELAAKTVEVEKSSVKLKKLGNELNNVLGELKHLKEAKLSVDNEVKNLKDKLKKSVVEASKPSAKETDEVVAKAKLLEVELAALKAEMKVLRDSNQELQERMDFYVGQCSEFEKNDSQLQDEISLLQISIKKATVENAAKVEKLEAARSSLEENLVFYKDQEEVIVDENEKLKKEVNNLKGHIERKNVNEDLLVKYNLKCDMIDELLKKHEKIAAQLRRKDWEIENYQKKLDSAFEAEFLSLPLVTKREDVQVDMVGGVAPSEVRSPECVALDLSVKEKEVNNNEVKEEEPAVAGPSGFVVASTKRKFSECSSASHSQDDSNQNSQHENLDASFDSTSTCPSEAAMVSNNTLQGQVVGRKRSRSFGIPLKKIPYVSLEDD